MSDPYKQIVVSECIVPVSAAAVREATFTRPSMDSQTIIINTPPEFHLDAGTLKVIADVLAHSTTAKIIV